MTEQTNTPALRFPGFSENWEIIKVRDLSQKTIGGGTPNTSKSNYWKGELNWIQSSDLSLDNLFKHRSKKYINDKALNNSSAKKIPANSIAIVSRVGVGKLVYINHEYATSQDFINLVHLNYPFKFIMYSLYLLLKGEANKLQGTSIKGLTKKDLLNYPLNIPKTIEEQEKIGVFFNKLDRQIELEEEKLELLEQQKRGYMQKIFSQELQFKDKVTNNFDKWSDFKIKDIFSKIESGNRLPKNNLLDGDIPYVIAQTTNNGVYMNISKNTLDYHGNNLKKFKKGSITISIDNPEAMFIQTHDFVTSNVMRVLYNENLSIEAHTFILYSLRKLTQTYNWSVKFSGPIIMDSKIKLPVKLNTNDINWNIVNKIGEFLIKLDFKIYQNTTKIELLKQRKKGLLQKMFI